MSIESVVTPPSKLDLAVQDLRMVQNVYDQASENYERLSIEVAEARVRRDSAGEALSSARNTLFEAAITPTHFDPAPIRVVPSYLAPETASEGAWSDKGSDA